MRLFFYLFLSAHQNTYRATTAFTLDTYSHVVPGLQEAAAKAFDNMFNVAPSVLSD